MTDKRKKITILGSTGSIGIQTLNVLESLDNDFEINYLTANSNIDKLAEQVIKYKPKGIAIGNIDSYYEFKRNYSFDGQILVGEDGIIEAASDSSNDLLVSSLVGFSGVKPTLAAIQKGIDVALANKETLVSAGSIITKAARDFNTKIIAIDSEHSAILQCLIGENPKQIEKIILTASGGPFLNTPIDEMPSITKTMALNHPNWSMGNKITIDSATMMNKGFEVIEAFWLFNLEIKQIEVLIHPQSIIHSMVQFVDGSIKAQLGLPDMRIPISYALSYPERFNFNFPRLDFNKISNLTFQQPDYEKYPCLKIAFDTLEAGATAPTILNAANEVAVEAFLNEKINFTDIFRIIEISLNKVEKINNADIEQIVITDSETRNFARQLVNNIY